MRVLLSSNEESQSLLCQNIQEKKKLLKPFEMCGFGKIGCLTVKQL